MKETKTIAYNARIRVETRTAINAACALLGISVAEFLAAAVAEYIERYQLNVNAILAARARQKAGQ